MILSTPRRQGTGGLLLLSKLKLFSGIVMVQVLSTKFPPGADHKAKKDTELLTKDNYDDVKMGGL